MSKPRINAKVAKLAIGKPYQWSATGIGVVALDNAIEAGHLIIVETGDENEYWVMRPTVSDLQGMIKSVNRFGKTVYSFPVAQDQPAPVENVETVSTEQEPEMTTTTQPTVDQFVARADAAVQAYDQASSEQYNQIADIMAEMIASSHHLARRRGLDWKSILADAATIYKATKEAAPAAQRPAKPAKAQQAAKAAGQVWTLRVELPTGLVEVQRSKPYSHAAAIETSDGWQVYAWVSSRETATKRIGDAKRAGIAVLSHAVIEVEIVGQPAQPSEAIEVDQPSQEPDRDMDGGPFYSEPTPEDVAAYREYQASGQEAADIAEITSQAQQPEQADATAQTWPYTEALPFEPTAADEIEREAEVEEPMHVKLVGGAAVHYSDDGDTTFCGIDGRDLRQVHDATTCRSCQKVAQARAAKA